MENYRYIKKTLEKLPQTPLLARIQRLGKASEQRQKQLSTHRPTSLAALTEREYEIVKLMASRLRNREIAEKLFLSEGSVKQYINQIYSKLQIEGDTHSKRKQLFQLLEEKPNFWLIAFCLLSSYNNSYGGIFYLLFLKKGGYPRGRTVIDSAKKEEYYDKTNIQQPACAGYGGRAAADDSMGG